MSSGVYHSLQLATHYKPGGQYHGDVTLIAAESSRLSLPGLGDDYGMKEVCTNRKYMSLFKEILLLNAFENKILKPLYSDGISHTDQSNKDGTVYSVILCYF